MASSVAYELAAFSVVASTSGNRRHHPAIRPPSCALGMNTISNAYVHGKGQEHSSNKQVVHERGERTGLDVARDTLRSEYGRHPKRRQHQRNQKRGSAGAKHIAGSRHERGLSGKRWIR